MISQNPNLFGRNVPTRLNPFVSERSRNFSKPKMILIGLFQHKFPIQCCCPSLDEDFLSSKAKHIAYQPFYFWMWPFPMPSIQGYSVEFDLGYGNHDVLVANIGILTASSFTLTVFHLRISSIYLVATLILGIVFLTNQIDELFSFLSLSASEDISLILFCLFTHLSHLVLSVVLFLKFFLRSTFILTDNLLIFVAAYWHLVEIVWILILLTLIGF